MIGSEKDTTRRKLREGLYIQAQDSSRDIETLMNIERGNAIHPSWDGTFEHINSIIEQKREKWMTDHDNAPISSLYSLKKRV